MNLAENHLTDFQYFKPLLTDGWFLTFNAFFAASAPERLSKVTKPTGWKRKKEQINGQCHLSKTHERHGNVIF